MKSMTRVNIVALTVLMLLAPATAFAQTADTPDTRPAAPASDQPAADQPAADQPVGDQAGTGEDAAASTEMAVSDDDPLVYQKGGLSGIGLVIGAKVGGGFPQVFNGFDTTYAAELEELGYTLPVLDRRIDIFVDGQYTAPTASKTNAGPDSRMPGDGTWNYDLTMHQVVLTLGAMFRLDVGSDLVVPYGALGGRMYLWKTDVSGDSNSQPFGNYNGRIQTTAATPRWAPTSSSAPAPSWWRPSSATPPSTTTSCATPTPARSTRWWATGCTCSALIHHKATERRRGRQKDTSFPVFPSVSPVTSVVNPAPQGATSGATPYFQISAATYGDLSPAKNSPSSRR